MGLSESSLKSCISEVLGSFDCTCKSKCLDSCKCLACYYHCRTATNDAEISSSSEDETIKTPSIF